MKEHEGGKDLCFIHSNPEIGACHIAGLVFC